jgi:hypothetical protein
LGVGVGVGVVLQQVGIVMLLDLDRQVVHGDEVERIVHGSATVTPRARLDNDRQRRPRCPARTEDGAARELCINSSPALQGGALPADNTRNLALSLARPSAASMQTTRVLSRRPASARRSPGASLPTLSWRGRTRLSPRARSASSWRACRWTSSCASTTTSSWPPLTRWTPRTMNELPRANKYVHPKVLYTR